MDNIPRYRGEADDIDTSSALPCGPFSTDIPLLSTARPAETSNVNRRGKRFDPYTAAGAKRPRRLTKGTPEASTSAEQASDSQPVTPVDSYPDPRAAIPPTPQHYPLPYSVSSFYQIPGYLMHPHPMFYPPANASTQPPQPPAQYPYIYQSAPGADPHQATDAQAYYSCPAPQAGTYPSGYATAWSPHGVYSSHVSQPLPAMQSSIASQGDDAPDGNNSAEEGSDTPT